MQIFGLVASDIGIGIAASQNFYINTFFIVGFEKHIFHLEILPHETNTATKISE